MKVSSIFLVLILISQLCWAKEQAILPVEPWRAIVFMEKYSPDLRWDGDVSVKMIGNYSASDSLMVSNSIEALNTLCETINLSFSNSDRGDLEVYFLDSTNEKSYESVIKLGRKRKSSWSCNFSKNRITHFNLALKLSTIQDDKKQNFLTNNLLFSLYPKRISSDYSHKRGRYAIERPQSIFNVEVYADKKHYYKPDYNSELSSFDKKLLKTVYANDFLEILPLAKKEYVRIPFWFSSNAKKILIFPLVLLLFAFTGLIRAFYKRIAFRIRNKFLRFNLVTLVSLIVVSSSISLYYVQADKLEDIYHSFFQWYDILGAILVSTIMGLLAANLIRVIELFIQRHAMPKNAKVFLLFLSTSLIPSMAIFSIFYFSPDGLNESYIKIVSTFFFLFTIIGVIRALISFFLIKEKEIKMETEVKLATMRELKTKAELNALHSKINPHFLYNALNSIAGLSRTDADKTEHMALSLSKLFRYSINKEQTDWSTLADEIEMVMIYLDIEKVRFDERLEFNVDLPEALKSAKVPRFMIQPLVENAVKHGIAPLVGQGEISINIQKEGKWLEISVADNGAEFPKELSPGFGLQSIYDKLEIMYPNRFELHFVNSPEKRILIKLA